MINEIGIAVLLLMLVMGAFQVRTVRRAKRMRGRRVDQLPVSADALLQGRENVLVYFFSANCTPCQSMTPAVDALCDKYPDLLIKVDIAEDPEYAVAFGIRVTPTLVRVEAGVIDGVYLGAKNLRRIEALLP